MSFWSNLGAEFVARRRRMRESLGDGRATPLEFLLLTAALSPLAGMALAPHGFWSTPWAPAGTLFLILAYVEVDARRQRALARGADAEATARKYDRTILGLFGLVALIGVATIAFALLVPAWHPPLPDKIPDAARITEIVPGQ